MTAQCIMWWDWDRAAEDSPVMGLRDISGTPTLAEFADIVAELRRRVETDSGRVPRRLVLQRGALPTATEQDLLALGQYLGMHIEIADFCTFPAPKGVKHSAPPTSSGSSPMVAGMAGTLTGGSRSSSGRASEPKSRRPRR